MTGKYTKAMAEEYRRQQDEKAAREAQERQERVEKESARRIWVRDGGAERDFEKSWPQLRDEQRRRRVMDADQRARASQRATGISRI